jgi:hypothetical protein
LTPPATRSCSGVISGVIPGDGIRRFNERNPELVR